MEVNFSELRQKDVINMVDGRHLGRVCNISFTFPECKILGLTVTGCKGFRFSKQEIFLPMDDVIKIGKDAVLVKFGTDDNDCPPPKQPKQPKTCPPPKPDCPPHGNQPPCCPPSFCPPPPSNGYPPQNRRSFDEYD